VDVPSVTALPARQQLRTDRRADTDQAWRKPDLYKSAVRTLHRWADRLL